MLKKKESASYKERNACVICGKTWESSRSDLSHAHILPKEVWKFASMDSKEEFVEVKKRRWFWNRG